MSKKAEERALETYPMKDYNKEPNYIHSCDSKMLDEVYRDVFKLGYKQAEKDMEWEIDHREEAYMQGFKDGTDNAEVLTWKDVQRIVEIADGLLAKESHTEILLAEFQSEESYYQEILKRFNEERK